MKKILFIEDEEGQRDYLELYFKRRNYNVLTCPDRESGLQLIKETSPDLVILDLVMEKMSGLDVLSQMRKSGSKVPVIVLSGKNEDEIMGEVQKLGISAFLPKPLRLEDLEKCISGILTDS